MFLPAYVYKQTQRTLYFRGFPGSSVGEYRVCVRDEPVFPSVHQTYRATYSFLFRIIKTRPGSCHLPWLVENPAGKSYKQRVAGNANQKFNKPPRVYINDDKHSRFELASTTLLSW